MTTLTRHDLSPPPMRANKEVQDASGSARRQHRIGRRRWISLFCGRRRSHLAQAWLLLGEVTLDPVDAACIIARSRERDGGSTS